MVRLQKAGVETDEEPGQEDSGWHFNFAVAEDEHCCVLGRRPAEAPESGTWIAWLERRRSFLGSLSGKRNRGIAATAVAPMHQALSGAHEISNVRWHSKTDFDRGCEELGATEP